jgi:hypothetical protein
MPRPSGIPERTGLSYEVNFDPYKGYHFMETIGMIGHPFMAAAVMDNLHPAFPRERMV